MKAVAEKRAARIYFSDFFEVPADALADYGAFNVACIVDLPLFIDPFCSSRAESLHTKLCITKSFVTSASFGINR